MENIVDGLLSMMHCHQCAAHSVRSVDVVHGPQRTVQSTVYGPQYTARVLVDVKHAPHTHAPHTHVPLDVTR